MAQHKIAAPDAKKEAAGSKKSIQKEAGEKRKSSYE